jgi:nucleotide-binding universal stress UspA family protein
MDLSHQGAGAATGLLWVPDNMPAGLSKDEAEVLGQANRTATVYLASVEKKLEEIGVHAETHLGFGNPDSHIAEEGIMSGATMIAMSGLSEMFWERGFLGSTTDRVLHTSLMPVIVFKPMEGLAAAVSVKPETIVIAVDGSTESEVGVGPAVKLADELGAKVALVHVLKRDSGRCREHAANYLDELNKHLGGKVEMSVISGKTDDEVILFADQFDHPMIAVTEHGGISIGRRLPGAGDPERQGSLEPASGAGSGSVRNLPARACWQTPPHLRRSSTSSL